MGNVPGCSAPSGSGHVDIGVFDGWEDKSVETEPKGLEVLPKVRSLTCSGWGKAASGCWKSFWGKG